MPQASPGGYAGIAPRGSRRRRSGASLPKSTAKKERGMSSLSALNGPRIKVGARAGQAYETIEVNPVTPLIGAEVGRVDLGS